MQAVDRRLDVLLSATFLVIELASLTFKLQLCVPAMLSKLLLIHLVDLKFLSFDLPSISLALQLQLRLTTAQICLKLLPLNRLKIGQLSLALLLEAQLLTTDQLSLLTLVCTQLPLSL